MTLQIPRVLGAESGQHYNFLNCRATVKLDGAATGGALSVIECLAPPGFGPPLHRHDVDDELFHIMGGRMRVQCGDTDETLQEGGTVWLPRGIPHTFQVLGDEPCRMLAITTPAQFEDFCATVGVPQDHTGLPEPIEIDPAQLAQRCAEYQMEVLGPPPPPLD